MVESKGKSVQLFDGLRQLANSYDGFIVDQWGVLHDGQAAYPGAVDCLLRLKDLGKRTAILSNSGKRFSVNEQRLAALGFERSSYSHLITSGDVAWKGLKTRVNEFYRKLGSRCLLLGSDGDTSVAEGLALDLVDDWQQADFIMLAGMDGRAAQLCRTSSLWNSAIARRLPMLCTNPDLTRLVDGGLAPGCGALALSYERLGGEVHYVGKPHAEVYEYCRSVFDEYSARRIVAIGDSLQHDVAGGNVAGFDTVFISGGIHRNDFAPALSRDAKQVRLAELIGSHSDRRPTGMLSSLHW